MPRKQLQQTRRKKPWKWAFLGIAVVIVAVVAFYFINLNNSLGGLSKSKGDSIFGQLRIPLQRSLLYGKAQNALTFSLWAAITGA